jgi:CBS domain-containing protein
LVDTNLLCGLNNVAPKPPPDVISQPRIHKSVSKLLRGTIVVGLWDSHAQEIRSVGSGFLVDKKLGLVVTAGHILFDMTEGKRFGTPYFGLKHARAVLGVIPDSQKAHKAVFRYFAELVAHDIGSVDACILRLTTRLERDVDGENCAGLAESPITNMKKENIHHLKMTRTFELEESVRILGFNQGGEGVLEQGKHVNRLADFAKGYICKRFTNMGSDDSSTSSQGSSKSLGDLPSRKADERLMRGSATSFVPREEIVVMCPTISGHSGGPCVNDEGRVVGILSRADPVDRQRCYLVPSAEIKALVNKAKANLKHVQL